MKKRIIVYAAAAVAALCMGGRAFAEELKENSWRYENGEHIVQEESEGGVSIMDDSVLVGIDVSEHQGTINWEKTASEIDYAILRCGYGSDLTKQDDKTWKYNADECTRLGIPFGVYLYSYADTPEKASSEADHVLRLIKDYELSYPVYYDMEDNIQLSLSAAQKGNLARIFCDKIQNAGYDAGVYASTYWWEDHLTSSVFDNPEWYKWVAQYAPACTYQGSYSMWQYTSKGSVSGISGDVDMNYWYRPEVKIKAVRSGDRLNIRIINRTGSTVDGALITIFRDSKGAVLGTDISEGTVKTIPPDAAAAEVFLWNSLNGMMPLCAKTRIAL